MCCNSFRVECDTAWDVYVCRGNGEDITEVLEHQSELASVIKVC